jgi:hypothetical protein
MKYQLLNPSPQFQGIVDIARSVILAGGTMSPVSMDNTSGVFLFLTARVSDIGRHQPTILIYATRETFQLLMWAHYTIIEPSNFGGDERPTWRGARIQGWKAE